MTTTNNTDIATMKWNEIPDATPMYEVLQAIGFPEPMIILKHINKSGDSRKSGKKPDLSTIVSFLWTPKGDVQEIIETVYKTASRNSEIRKYLVKHPAQTLLLVQTYTQIQNEPISVVAERNLNEWRKLLIEEGVWNNLMQETPLTIIDKIMKMFTDTDYLNMPLSEYYEMFSAEEAFEKASIKAIGDKFVEKEEKERRMKELQAELEAAGLGDFESMLRMAMFGGRAGGFKYPGMDNDNAGQDDSEDDEE